MPSMPKSFLGHPRWYRSIGSATYQYGKGTPDNYIRFKNDIDSICNDLSFASINKYEDVRDVGKFTPILWLVFTKQKNDEFARSLITHFIKVGADLNLPAKIVGFWDYKLVSIGSLLNANNDKEFKISSEEIEERNLMNKLLIEINNGGSNMDPTGKWKGRIAGVVNRSNRANPQQLEKELPPPPNQNLGNGYNRKSLPPPKLFEKAPPEQTAQNGENPNSLPETKLQEIATPKPEVRNVIPGGTGISRGLKRGTGTRMLAVGGKRKSRRGKKAKRTRRRT